MWVQSAAHADSWLSWTRGALTSPPVSSSCRPASRWELTIATATVRTNPSNQVRSTSSSCWLNSAAPRGWVELALQCFHQSIHQSPARRLFMLSFYGVSPWTENVCHQRLHGHSDDPGAGGWPPAHRDRRRAHMGGRPGPGCGLHHLYRHCHSLI